MNQTGISVNPTNVEAAARYAEAGFEVMEVELPTMSPEINLSFAERALTLGTKCGMTLWSVHLPHGRQTDISAPEETRRLFALELLLPYIPLAKEWGAHVLVVHSGSEPGEQADRAARIEACARSLDVLQREAGDLPIAIENLPRTCIGRDSSEVLALAEHCAGICFDVNHLLTESHESFMNRTASRIITTHLSDYDGINERHWMPGTGIVPWKSVYERLMQASYRNPWIFEVGRNPDGSIMNPQKMLRAWKDASGLK